MKLRPSKGFTLIELLIVLVITALLSGIAITYSHIGQSEESLSIEASKISELILQAKALSIATYNANSTTCAYGVHFDFTTQTYSLFAYDSAVPINNSAQLYCPTYASTTAQGVILADMQPYASGGTWQIPVSKGVVIESSSPVNTNPILTDVLFFPPDPLTLMSTDDTTFPTSTPSTQVYLKESVGNGTISISVSPAGQVQY
jgi:prepilin-type N-terminal cleavage/methylation domain-containing protein